VEVTCKLASASLHRFGFSLKKEEEEEENSRVWYHRAVPG
jgi:hypothetical protein